MGHYLKKPRRYNGEYCAQGGPKAKTRGAAGPEGFGRGTSRGKTFTMIPPRLFHIMSLLQHPGLVKRDFFQVGFGQWTPQGVHWILYRAWTANIGRVKSQYTSPERYNNAYCLSFISRELCDQRGFRIQFYSVLFHSSIQYLSNIKKFPSFT